MKYKIICLLLFLGGSLLGCFSGAIIQDTRLKIENRSLRSCLEDYRNFKRRYPNADEGLSQILIENLDKEYDGEYAVKEKLAKFSVGEFIYLPIPIDSDEPQSYKLLF